MRAAQCGKRGILFLFTLARQPRHFNTGRQHRAAAIVASRNAGKCGDAFPEKFDCPAVFVQFVH
jgi:hypothetical protein